jgi:hypothetical protein
LRLDRFDDGAQRPCTAVDVADRNHSSRHEFVEPRGP